MELLQYWHIIRKRLWLIIILMLVAVSGTWYYLQQQIPQYTASTTLFINPRQVSPLLPGGAEGFAIAGGSNTVVVLANTYDVLLETRSFLREVIEEVGMTISTEDMEEVLSSEYIPETQFYRISATHPDPETAQEIANVAAQILIASEIERNQDEQAQVEASQGTLAEQQAMSELHALLQAELDYYNDRIDDAEDQLRQLQQAPTTADDTEDTAALITRLESLRYSRIDVQARIAALEHDMAELSASSEPIATAVVVDAAVLPDEPDSLQVVQSIILALLVAALLGSGIAFLIEYLDFTIKNPETLEQLYQMPVLGTIQSSKAKGHLVMHASNSLIAEAFRSLRTSIQVEMMDAGFKTLLVTSSQQGEGKTFVAANLAVSLALSGRRVIVVDTDLRKPRMHQAFGVERDVGFTNLVVNQEHQIEDVLKETSIRNLRVLTCGAIPPNPSELLQSRRAHMLIERLRAHADILIYDSPPITTVTDAAVLARHADGVIQVVWAAQTHSNLALRGKAMLEQMGAKMLGPVLNRVKPSDLGYSSYYQYHYKGYQDYEPDMSRTWWPKSKVRRTASEPHADVSPEAYVQAVEYTNGTTTHGKTYSREGIDDHGDREVSE
jgi:non-specific protein-tyrosine kinase